MQEWTVASWGRVIHATPFSKSEAAWEDKGATAESLWEVTVEQASPHRLQA